MMKRLVAISLLITAVFAAAEAEAQQITKKRIGAYVENRTAVVAEANTTLAVDIVVEIEQFTAGPYARYAERMLGCKARLSDNVTYRILSVNVGTVEDGTYYDIEDVEPTEYSTSASQGKPFSGLLPDRMTSVKRELEDYAKSTATDIFTLRSTRFELITAELGDGIYGAGLESALREIDKLEREYTELFLGKQTITTKHYRYYVQVKPAEFEKVEPVVVEEGAEPVVVEPKMLPQSHIIARFGEHVGLVSKDEFAGDIILLTINPTEMSYPESNIKGKVTYRYANNAEVILSVGRNIITKRQLPIYEFGRTVTLLVPAR